MAKHGTTKSRLNWAAIATSLPPALVAAQFIHVLVVPGVPGTAAWVEDAKWLAALELFLLLTGPAVVTLAERVAEGRRAASLFGMTAVCAVLVYGLWRWSGDATLAAIVCVLMAGRFAGAVLGGEEARFELYERWIVGMLLFVLVMLLLFVVRPPFMDQMLRFASDDSRWLLLCAVYYSLLAAIEAVALYPKWRAQASRRPAFFLQQPAYPGDTGTRLEFAGSAAEIVTDMRIRPAARLFVGIVGVALLATAIVQLATRGPGVLATGIFWILSVLGGIALWGAVRRGPDRHRVQFVQGELAVVESARGKVIRTKKTATKDLGPLETFAVGKTGDWAGIRVQPKRSALPIHVGPHRPRKEAATLTQLLTRFLEGRASPDDMRHAFEVDPVLCALLGPDLRRHLATPGTATQAKGDLNCPECGKPVVPEAPRCPCCGLLRPAYGAGVSR